MVLTKDQIALQGMSYISAYRLECKFSFFFFHRRCFPELVRRQIPWSSSIPPMDIFHAKKPCVSILSPIEIYKTFMLNPTPGQNTTILVCLFEKVSRASHSTLSWCEHVIYWSRVTKMDLCGLNWMKGILDPVECHRVVRMGLKEDSRM